LKNIADDVKLDISTISRVANSKYIETPYGIFLVKYFFSESQSKSDGSNVSNREVKNLIIDMIKTENKVKPLTDTEIMKKLNTKGYNIARRTVSKYRENLKIPIARLRREII
jgi:RNA polymerase sigma-54 factor